MCRRKVWSVVAILLVFGEYDFLRGSTGSDELSGDDTCKRKEDFIV